MLLIWIPGTDGTIKNLGLTTLPTPSYLSVASNDSGKLGKCISGKWNYHFTSDPLTNNYTVATWVKFSSISEYNNIITCKNTSDSSPYLFYISYLGSSGGTTWNFGSEGGIVQGNLSGVTVTTGVWYHIACVHTDTSAALYVNGQLVNSTTFSTPTRGTYLNLGIMGRSTNTAGTTFTPANGYINDFRLYDHALSSQEVKDLAKGLVGHWLGNDWQVLRSGLNSAGWNLLLNPSRYVSSFTNLGVTVTLNKTTGEIILNGTSTAYNVLNIGYTTNATTSGHKYIMIGCPKGGSNVQSSSGTYDYRLNLGEDTYQSEIGNGAIFTGGSNANLYIRVANGYTCNNVKFYPMLIDLTAIYGSGNEPDADTFRKAFPMQYYPYSALTTTDLRLPIPDISGLHNDLTANGTITLSSDTKRYDRSCYFNGNSYLTSPTVPFNKAFPFSYWCKWNGTSSIHIIDSRNNSGGGYELGYTTSSGIEILNSSVGYITTDVGLTANVWKHICITYDGTNVKIYADGVLKSTTAKTLPDCSTVIVFGARYSYSANYTGNLSDIRLYSTALSASDIQELYNLGV